MMRVALLFLAVVAIAGAGESTWPQFRGPGGLGLGSGKPPVEFNADKNLRWKTEVPPGHSSPCIWGNRIFLTGLADGKLVTVCLDRADGRQLWRAIAPAEKIEPTHRIGSPASPTPCTDGERVYVYFGSYGLLAYDFSGKEIWKKPLPLPVVEFGTGASPAATSSSSAIRTSADTCWRSTPARAPRSGARIVRISAAAFRRRSCGNTMAWRNSSSPVRSGCAATR